MGLFDSNKRTTNTTQTVNTTESNQQSGQLNLAKNSLMNGDVTISNGVIEANEEMRKLGTAAFDFGGDTVRDAFKFGDDALKFGDNAIEANGKVIKDGFSFAESLVNQQTANSNNSTLAIKDLAKSIASGGASDTVDMNTKTVYVMGGVVALVLIVMMFRG